MAELIRAYAIRNGTAGTTSSGKRRRARVLRRWRARPASNSPPSFFWRSPFSPSSCHSRSDPPHNRRRHLNVIAGRTRGVVPNIFNNRSDGCDRRLRDTIDHKVVAKDTAQ
jgi:hypothetical protein